LLRLNLDVIEIKWNFKYFEPLPFLVVFVYQVIIKLFEICVARVWFIGRYIFTFYIFCSVTFSKFLFVSSHADCPIERTRGIARKFSRGDFQIFCVFRPEIFFSKTLGNWRIFWRGRGLPNLPLATYLERTLYDPATKK